VEKREVRLNRMGHGAMGPVRSPAREIGVEGSVATDREALEPGSAMRLQVAVKKWVKGYRPDPVRDATIVPSQVTAKAGLGNPTR